MTLHISNVKYNVLGITTVRCLGYISTLNRPSLNVLDYKKNVIHFSYFTSSNVYLRDININGLQSSQQSLNN